MRIASIDVENFKSLANFSLPLAKFNCLIGLNGAGKSTLLQFIDFLATQMRGDVSSWLDARSWKATDFHSSTSSKKNVS
ncbi:MAG TPA: AAA family ATPase, partial [Pirellulales bacterium]